MAQQAWDDKLTDFLKAAGEELRRTGEELKAETQRLLDEVSDSEVQAKMKERIHQLGQVAKKTAAEAASKLQEAFGGKPKKPARKATRSKPTRKVKKSAKKKGTRRSARRG
jgi:hypothetical protein